VITDYEHFTQTQIIEKCPFGVEGNKIIASLAPTTGIKPPNCHGFSFRIDYFDSNRPTNMNFLVAVLAMLVAVVAAQPIYQNVAVQPIYQPVAVRETREVPRARVLRWTPTSQREPPVWIFL
jgi:hypothetical protein